MNGHEWWYLSRATGVVAWVLATAAVLWGMALSTRALGPKPKAPWLLDLHRYLGGLTVLFVFAHMGSLIADSYTDFSIRDLLVPGASSWKPLPVAFGVLAFYFLLAVEVTSLLKTRLPKWLWHWVHLTSYAVYVLASIHFLVAGTDAAGWTARVAVIVASSMILFFIVYLMVGPGRAASVRSSKPRRVSEAREPHQSARPRSLGAHDAATKVEAGLRPGPGSDDASA